MRDYSCYLFDADGTLFDTSELIYACFTNTAKVFGHHPIEKTDVIKYIGLTLKDQMRNYFGPLSDDAFKEYRKVHMDYQMTIYKNYLALFEEVRETLAQLKRSGKLCGVVTSRLLETLQLYLKEMAIASYFDILVTPEHTVKHKPEPEPALYALKVLSIEASDALFIGDSLYDIECGHRAGMSTAFVAWSRTPALSLSIQPTYIINNMRELCI